jgi:hypothetical protein
MSRERTAEAASAKNVAMAQEPGPPPSTLNDSSNDEKTILIEKSTNIMPSFFDENNIQHEGFAIPKGFVDGPEGAINVVEADLGTAKAMMADPFYPPEQMIFQIDTTDKEFEKLVKDPRYSQYSIERSDTTEKKREREVARIEKRMGEEQSLVSPYWTQGEPSQNEMTMLGRFGLSTAPPERKKQIYESLESAEKQFALNKSNYEMLLEKSRMNYIELAKKTGMSTVASHSLKQEIDTLLEELTPLVSMKSEREFAEESARVREIMSKSEGPYSQARSDFKAIIKDSKSTSAESDSAKRALKRIEDPTREVDDDVIAAYESNAAFASSLSDLDEGFDMVKTAFIKGGIKKISDSMSTKEDMVIAGQQMQAMAMAKTINNTDLLNQLGEFSRNVSHNTAITEELKPLRAALASGSIDVVDDIMNKLVSDKNYAIKVDRGGKELEPLKITDDQKRQLFLTLCSPQAGSLINAWSFVSDNPMDRDGNYSLQEDYVIQSIEDLVAKGRTEEARVTALNALSIAEKNGALGVYGKSKKYWEDLFGRLGI